MKQTALAQWPPAPTEPEAWMIDSDDLLDGQAWSFYADATAASTYATRPNDRRPVWVTELLDVPVVWPWHTFTPEGYCIAWCNTLPIGTTVSQVVGGSTWVHGGLDPTSYIVIVVAWPDGTSPVKPQGGDQ